MRFAMAQITGRRANQLGDLMRMLEFRAVHLDHRSRIPEENLRGCLHNARLPRPRWPQKQQIPHRTPARAHPRAEYLREVHERADALFRSNDRLAERMLEFLRLDASQGRIQRPT